MKLLIPGGAGYIGSHLVRNAQEEGYEVTVIDDFSTGHEWALKDCEILEANLLDKERLSKLLKGRHFDGVIHLAAKSSVEESIRKPLLYYKNNIIGTLNLLGEMLRNDLTNLVFSSSASIFGNPLTAKISEDHPKNPINPYGKSKLIVEKILEDICSTGHLNAISLRYFNAAGAHESAEIGEDRDPETHLIPNVLKSAISLDSNLVVHGSDYPTPDGTCIRDYVQVMDLSRAHLLSLEYMKSNKGFSAFNLGNGNGFSVLEVINESIKITKKEISYKFSERRLGDPATLVADNKLAKSELNWKPKYRDIHSIIKTAWLWHIS